MIDINLIRNKPEIVKENIKKKFQDNKLVLVDEVIELDKQNRALKQEGDDLRALRNKLSAEVGKFMKEKNFEEAEKIKAQVKANGERIVQIEAEQARIDEEVKKIIDKAYKTAEYILSQNIDKLHTVANILLEKEKIDGEEFAEIFKD